MLNPAVQPVDVSDEAGKDVFLATVNDSGRVALQVAADRHDIAAYFRMGSKGHVSQHRNGVALDAAVDINVAQNRDSGFGHSAGYVRVSEDGHDVSGVSLTARVPEDRDHRVGTLSGRQVRIVADVDHVVAVSAVRVHGERHGA